MDDDDFLRSITDALAGLPGVLAVALGGSRAQGTARVDSDWDLALYYRGHFDPDDLRALGWDGEASELGGWGRLFNGGGWFTVDGRRVDVHYRDLDVIDRVLADAVAGRFEIVPLLFHQAGIPSYLLAAELAVNRTLAGELPRPAFPVALRQEAPPEWWRRADLTMGYARTGYAERGRVAQCAGLISEAACYAAHAVLAARGRWVTNEKRLLESAGLLEIDAIVAGLNDDAESLMAAVDRAREALTVAYREATATVQV
jgi:Nucleotidyltransferase domain.